MILPSPITLYLTAASLALGATAGYKLRDWQCDAAMAKALEQAAKQQKEMQDEVEQSARAYEEAKSATHEQQAIVEREIRTIYKNVPVPPPSCAVPADVVGLLKGSVSSANASASGKPSQ